MGYFDSLLRYFEFSGRSSRSQYWTYYSVSLLLMIGAFFADFRLVGHIPTPEQPGLFSAFVVIFHVIPNITISVRRLHDIGRSGWWLLLCLVPFGGLLILVWSFFGSEAGSNRFGDDPHDGSGGSPKEEREPTTFRGVRTGPPKPQPATGYDPETAATARFI
jgi:uncharacterized membrane protein YhaH (DUF805 family)